MNDSTFMLDLPADLLGKVSSFAAGVKGLTFAQLVVIAGRLDVQRQKIRAVQANGAAISGLAPDCEASLARTRASLADHETHVAAMFELVEAELERRLSAPAARA